MQRKVLYLGLIATTVLAGGLVQRGAIAADSAPKFVSAAVANWGRPRLDKAKDADRKPEEVLAFAGVKPGDKVVDFVPGNAYYTRMLSYIVGPKGTVYALVPRLLPPGAANGVGCGPKDGPSLAEALFAMQALKEFRNLEVLCEGTTSFSLPEQIDVAFTAYGYHDLQNANKDKMAELAKNIFAGLKPGGTLVVVDYAAAPGAGAGANALHRSDADAAKAELAAAGFTFDGDSKSLGNAADNHSVAADDASQGDHADRFILRFKKPASAPKDHRPVAAVALKNWYGNTFRLGTPENWGRSIFYTADGNYHEFANNDLSVMQSGSIFFDALGNICYFKEYPAAERGNTGCHPFVKEHIEAKIGDNFVETSNGRGAPVGLVAGQVFPPFPPPKPQAPQTPPQ